MADNLPYVTSVGTLEKMLEKIKSAAIPERFTQDFVGTILSMPGGTPQAVMPFMKKMGFVSGNGEPTDLYREYKNPEKSGYAIAKAFKKLYAKLYEKNEFVESAKDEDVKGLIIECTGAEKNAATVRQTLSTINLLKRLADFSVFRTEEVEDSEIVKEKPINDRFQDNLPQIRGNQSTSTGINLSYTINLNLPATKDVEVFDAIFRSLKRHLIEGIQ